MEDHGQGIKVEVRGSRSGEGSRLGVKIGVKVGGGVKVWGVEVVKVGGQDRGRGQGLGVKVVFKVGGSRSLGQGKGYDRWSQSRVQCRGSKSGVNVRGGNVWGRVMVRGMS